MQRVEGAQLLIRWRGCGFTLGNHVFGAFRAESLERGSLFPILLCPALFCSIFIKRFDLPGRFVSKPQNEHVLSIGGFKAADARKVIKINITEYCECPSPLRPAYLRHLAVIHRSREEQNLMPLLRLDFFFNAFYYFRFYPHWRLGQNWRNHPIHQHGMISQMHRATLDCLKANSRSFLFSNFWLVIGKDFLSNQRLCGRDRDSNDGELEDVHSSSESAQHLSLETLR